MGDFNYTNINWVNGTVISVKRQKCINLLQENVMGEFIEAPSRNEDVLLDII